MMPDVALVEFPPMKLKVRVVTKVARGKGKF